MDKVARLQELRRRVADAAERVAGLGGWGGRVETDTLLGRLPRLEDGIVVDGRGGFDAGIACALDLIPRDRQELAARLHAAYTPEAVARARQESIELDPDSETTWWLAACHVCGEGPGDLDRFLDQLEEFEALRNDPGARLAAAEGALREMRSSFTVDDDGFAEAVRDGGMQGAYLSGHELAGMYAEGYGLYFLGTFHASLGLEDFQWKEPGDPAAPAIDGRLGRSGPVGGSSQFVKCADRDEYLAARAAATVSVHPKR